MREEHAVVEQLAQKLGDRAAAVPRACLTAWVRETAVQLDEFNRHLRKHFELEQEGGYLEAVTERSPGLQPEVERLQHEHDEIGRILNSIHHDLTTAGDQDRIVIDDCCCRIRNLLRYIRDHEEREDLMVLSAFNSDLGTKD